MSVVEAVQEDAGERPSLAGAAGSAAQGPAGASSAAPGGVGDGASSGLQQHEADSDNEEVEQSSAAAEEAVAGVADALRMNGKQLLGRITAGPRPVEVKQEAGDQAEQGQVEANREEHASPQQQHDDTELVAARGTDKQQAAAAVACAVSPAAPAGALGRSGSTASLLGQKRAREGGSARAAGSAASGDGQPSSSCLQPRSAVSTELRNGKMRRLDSLASVGARSTGGHGCPSAAAPHTFLFAF